MNYQYLSSPVGKLRLVSNGESLVAIEFENLQTATIEGEERIDPVLKACGDQLKEYFAGKRQHFDLPLAPTGTEFQKNVWQALTCFVSYNFMTYLHWNDIFQETHKPSSLPLIREIKIHPILKCFYTQTSPMCTMPQYQLFQI